jgi:hypothetical protein
VTFLLHSFSPTFSVDQGKAKDAADSTHEQGPCGPKQGYVQEDGESGGSSDTLCNVQCRNAETSRIVA